MRTEFYGRPGALSACATAREAIGHGRFMEVHVSTALPVCEARDPKGMYRRARTGQLPGFTGIGAPYEAPEHPALKLDLGVIDIGSAVDAVLAALFSFETMFRAMERAQALRGHDSQHRA